MAFCTACGKSLQEGARFCTSCGAPVQSIPAPTIAVADSASVPAAVAPAIVSPEPRAAVVESTPISEAVPVVPATELPMAPASTISPFFVIVCIILVLLIGGGIAGTVYIRSQSKPKSEAQAAEKAQATQPIERTQPAAAQSPAVADSIRALNLGNYPGATPVAMGTLSGDTVIAGFLTHDTPEQVMQFYKIRFPVATSSVAEGKAQLSATLPAGERIRVDAQPQGGSTQVMIVQEK